ncbi:response regulator [Sedimenticola thiotaurini]|uniref:Regulator n=1 Tax=Sedimenticola thiotaurini TaxID=1543721 RepID=A0A0F7JW94_9GAMM|nr:response regulator [Sedimenticola thiotaurini]AKH19922.1 regulator [Sedimenticola thiotaurini]
MRILLVEDDQLLGDGLCVGLEQMGYTVDWISDGFQAELALQDHSLDLAILDISLPGQDGLTLLRRIRQQDNPIPVLLLTARDSLNDRVIGLDSGADDYLPKPFDLEELAARLRAIARRRAGRGTPLLRHGAITLDPAARTVHLNDQPVSCTSREYAILETLLLNSGQVLSRQRLEEALYGWDDGVESNAIEVYIHHLRKKLGKSTIQTVRGIGYIIPKQAGPNG